MTRPNQASVQIGHYSVSMTSTPSRGDLNLSWREWEVLQHIVQGHATSQIATIMGVSRHTADTFRRRIYEKLGVNTAASAAAIATAYQSGAQICQTRDELGHIDTEWPNNSDVPIEQRAGTGSWK